MNARGIPTAAYQVLHLFPEVGYTPGQVQQGGGVPPSRGYPLGQVRWGGTPLSDGGGGYCEGGAPQPGPTGILEMGYPPVRVPPPSWLDLARVPPPPQVWTDKQSETITSRLVLRTRSVTKIH